MSDCSIGHAAGTGARRWLHSRELHRSRLSVELALRTVELAEQRQSHLPLHEGDRAVRGLHYECWH